MQCIIIPDDPSKPVEWDVELPQFQTLEALQEIVHGNIEAVPMTPAISDPHARSASTGYVNEEGKYHPDCKPNMRATDFMVPGVGLFMGDHVAGPMVIVGFNPSDGNHTAEVPKAVVERVRLIESEAGLRPAEA
jgi:hypothetical protein